MTKKKTIVVQSILGILFLAGAIVLTYFLPAILGANAMFKNTNILNVGRVFEVIGASFTQIGEYSFIMFGLLGFFGIFFLVSLIMMIVKRKFGYIAILIVYILFAFAAAYGLTLYMGNAPFGTYFPAADINTVGGIVGNGNYAGYVGFILNYWNCGPKPVIDIWQLILCYVPVALALVGVILFIIASINLPISLSREVAPAAKKKKAKKPTGDEKKVMRVYEGDVEDPSEEELAKDLAKGEVEGPRKVSEVPNATPVASPAPANATPFMNGPFLIQYVNSYGPNGAVEPVRNGNGLTEEDIRRIIREETGKKEEKPAEEKCEEETTTKKGSVIVSIPAPAPVAAPVPAEDEFVPSEKNIRDIIKSALEDNERAKEEAELRAKGGLSADDVREIVGDELRALTYDDITGEDIVVGAAEKPLTAEEIRKIVNESLEAKKAEEEPAPVEPEPEPEPKLTEESIRQIIKEAMEAYHLEKSEPEEEPKEEEIVEPAPGLTADDIRVIFAEELSKLPKEEKKEEPEALTADMIREIVRAEVKAAEPVKEEHPAPISVVIREPEPVKEEPKVEEEKPEPAPAPAPAPAPIPTINVYVTNPAPVIAAPAPAPEPEPEPEPAPEPEPEPEGEATKIIRIPFSERMAAADDQMKANYNELKSEIMSYGVKCRTSNAGDTFRLHKVTYIRITIAGKSLKLYMALDPKEYANSTLPISDASDKKIYEDIPLVFKVKSDLSVRRAKQLIADVFDRANIDQGPIVQRDWANDHTPSEDDGEDDE